MAQFFPKGQVMGFIFSLVLTVAAMLVYFLDMSFGMGMAVLLITAFLQATLQLVVFMHAGESDDKWTIYTNVVYGMVIALMTVFGSLLIFNWDM